MAFTRFLCVLPDHNRLKITFTMPNESGALGRVLSMISDYGVNLTQFHSFPFRECEDWNYRFFAELNLNLLRKEAKALR